GELGQERGDEVLSAREKEVRHYDEHDCQHDRSRLCEVQSGGKQHAAGSGDEKQLLFRSVRVGPRADERRGEQHRKVRDRQGGCPRECGPRRLFRDRRDEICVEHRGDHHRGVTRVREVVHAPRPDFAQRNVRRERARSRLPHARFYLCGYSFGPMQHAAKAPDQERRLTLSEVIDWLVEDVMIDAASADKLRKERRYYRGTSHPLVIIADQKWKSASPPHRPLMLEHLTEWLAKRVGMEYLHIDPLKMDFSAVTDIMSSAYATRFRILPVGVTSKEATIATAEPYVREWEKELQPIIKRDIKRVIASPLDLERYQVEFYNLARSIKGASKKQAGVSGLSNFEQLVELGKENKQFDANDAHIVRIVDWLWQYAFEQRASDIHVEPRREQGIVRFRIDGVLHQVYQIPPHVLTAMTSRIKILARMDVVEKRRPQDGRIKTRTADGEEIELRLSTLPTAFGEKLVMRIFDPEVLVRDFKDLGFSKEEL